MALQPVGTNERSSGAAAMEGSTTENYVFAGISLLIAVFYLVFSFNNMFGHLLGSFGRKFIFEMDDVMGGLLGIPHYSKLEAVVLFFASIGFFLTWSHNPTISFVSVLGILAGAVYMLICVFYGIFARQPPAVFAAPFLVNLGLLIWRAVRFLDPRHHVAAGACGAAGLLICLLSFVVMKLRAERCEPVVVKLLQINKFEKQLKEKKEPLVWLRGNDVPEGFLAARDSGSLLL